MFVYSYKKVKKKNKEKKKASHFLQFHKCPAEGRWGVAEWWWAEQRSTDVFNANILVCAAVS